MNKYICFYKNKRTEVHATTVLEAQTKAVKFFKAKKSWEVTTILAEMNGTQVVHTADF